VKKNECIKHDAKRRMFCLTGARFACHGLHQACENSPVSMAGSLAQKTQQASKAVTQYNKSCNMCRLQFVDSHLVDGNKQFHTFFSPGHEKPKTENRTEKNRTDWFRFLIRFQKSRNRNNLGQFGSRVRLTELTCRNRTCFLIPLHNHDFIYA
jgi:hypothetical protein